MRCKECGGITGPLGIIIHKDNCKFKNGYGAAGNVTEPIGASGEGYTNKYKPLKKDKNN